MAFYRLARNQQHEISFKQKKKRNVRLKMLEDVSKIIHICKPDPFDFSSIEINEIPINYFSYKIVCVCFFFIFGEM